MSLCIWVLNSEGVIFGVVQHEIICALPSLNKYLYIEVHTHFVTTFFRSKKLHIYSPSDSIEY